MNGFHALLSQLPELSVNRYKEQHKNIVIVSVNGEQTVKLPWQEGGKIMLMPGNGSYKPVQITKDMDFRVLGVVTWVVMKTV